MKVKSIFLGLIFGINLLITNPAQAIDKKTVAKIGVVSGITATLYCIKLISNTPPVYKKMRNSFFEFMNFDANYNLQDLSDAFNDDKEQNLKNINKIRIILPLSVAILGFSINYLRK